MNYNLDAELVFDKFLGNSNVLDDLQRLLVKHAQRWARRVRIWKGPGDEIPVELNGSAALRRAVVQAATERGSSYETLVAKYGPGDERLQGSAEMHGHDSGLIVVVRIDQKPLARFAGRLLLGNAISFQIRHPRIEDRPAEEWAATMMGDACALMSPVWASARTTEEYQAKVMRNGNAAGRDFSRFLPGLFWLNFFGAPYVATIGPDKLEAVPALHKPIDSGILIQLHSDPSAWTSPEYRTVEERVRNSIGSDFFFSKAAAASRSRAPEFAH